MLVDADFHIHSKYSGGTSSEMELRAVARVAELKGLGLVGTGDALHPNWRKELRELEEEEEGVYGINSHRTKFVITAEVEDANRVHHLLILPSISAAESLAETLLRHALDQDGRPRLWLPAPAVVEAAREVDALVGPSHAFTPWTAVYKEFNSLKECYEDQLRNISFVELGLSADTQMADRISELQDLTFLTNSDAHSPSPRRLGREFNRLELQELSYKSIKAAILRKSGGVKLNVGLNPKEGKYHVTACCRCYLKYKLKDAVALRWRCASCGGKIKKGVSDRVEELATWSKPHHPWHRPKYLHIIPLIELIELAIQHRLLAARRAEDVWEDFVWKFGSEIRVLVDLSFEELQSFNESIAELVRAFREGKMRYVAGGGGRYGRPTLREEREDYWQPEVRLVDFL